VRLEVVNTVAELRRAVSRARQGGRTIGLVPTMGALHAGHASLIRAARQETGCVVVSIFVNPTQFGPSEDFTRYPRTWDDDLGVCVSEGVDVVFAPGAEKVYPPGFVTQVEVTRLQDVLEGASRPGHFRGVATVVAKLFNMVQPDIAYFGQKDAQQALIIRQMVRDLNWSIELRICPTVRELDGLALSSRNRYLSPRERQHATCLFRALQRAEAMVASGERDAARVRRAMVEIIEKTPDAALDYAELVDHETLEPVTIVWGEVLAALAVRFGNTRLIDNSVLQG
jgi:pantoate--beta-alanine ligase